MVRLFFRQKLYVGVALLSVAVAYQNCSRPVSLRSETAQSSTSTTPPDGAANPAGGGAGEKVAGSTSVTTANGVVAKIQNGLEGNASSTAGNFAKALTQLKGNLPQTADPSKATGYDQIQLLVYAACSDLTTGTPAKMQSVYSVDPSKSIATNRGALITAGVKMVDQYVAGLASQGPTSSDVSSAIGKVVDQVAGAAGNTSKIAFMSVCIAANTAGTTLLGF